MYLLAAIPGISPPGSLVMDVPFLELQSSDVTYRKTFTVRSFKVPPDKLLEGFYECTSFPLPSTAQKE